VATLPAGTGIQELAFSPDGHRLAAAGDDSHIWIWDITTPANTPVPSLLSGHDSDVKSVAFSPDGRFLASASLDATVRLWALDNPAPRDRTPPFTPPDNLRGNPRSIAHPDVVYSVAFSGDGNTLASAGADGRVRLWDVHDREHPTALADLAGHTERVYSVTFGPDGHTLASASQDHTARLWDIDPDVAAARVCTLADSPVDRTTWDRYFPGIAYNPPC
jgi:WD40 repeat protein